MAVAIPVGRIMAKMAVVGFVTGVGLEVFMVATGFCELRFERVVLAAIIAGAPLRASIQHHGRHVQVIFSNADGVATRKEAERRVEAREALKDIRQTQRRRWRDALADSVRDQGDASTTDSASSHKASHVDARN